jgi:ornithine carbamoyltransferase
MAPVAVNLKGRSFLSMLDFSREEILAVLNTALAVKAGKTKGLPLVNKTLAMIFQKPSLRTRVSFETGMTRLGGHAIYLAPTDISIGKRESTEDIALVLSRYVDVIMARVFGHNIVEDLAKHAGVPVINGLSDFEHPCQIMADLLTVLERKGRLSGLKGCYIGDGNNVCHSLMLGAARVGMHFVAITPKGYEPQRSVLDSAVEEGAKSGATITVESDLAAAAGADMVYTDVWASMGQEAEAEARKQIFKDYRIDANTMRIAHKDCVILHCLPAHYGDEIDYATSRTLNSALFDQAENRMHAQNAIMLHLLGVAPASRSAKAVPAARKPAAKKSAPKPKRKKARR